MSALPSVRGAMPRGDTVADMMRLAELLAQSDMVPDAYRGKPQNVFLALQWASELGLGPLQALQNVAVINGRPSIWGDAALALVRSHPACISVREGVEGAGDDRHGWCEVARKGQQPERRTFSVADAKRARLWGKTGPWTQYTDRMLQLRARGFALRDVFPDALRGVITVEEAQDVEPEPRFVAATEASTRSDAVGPTALVGLTEFKLPALRDALDGCTTPEALRAYLERAESWLARLRRNHPDRAREADAMVANAWERVREAEATPLWCIVGRDGSRVRCEGRKEWLAVWRQRVAAIEAALRSAAARRAALEAMLRANHHALRAVERANPMTALEATRASADADCRIAAEEGAVPAVAAE